MLERPYTVAALSQKIANALGDLGTISVQGELSQAKVHASGHLYATLKDSDAVISLVMWRSTVVRNGTLPKEGSLVLVRGNVTVYPPRGQYQITATKIQPLGQGDLAARFEQLKAKLAAEGLFNDEKKRPLPFLPRAVGLATAGNSAALADMVHSLRTRFPRIPIVHANCPVQGSQAAAGIVSAIRRLERHPEVDVIICGRGGGSVEDLWAFNEEIVVRAIAGCVKPIVSAVGHETDVTLADFAADLRAKTPTAAAELVVPVEAELRERLDDLRGDLDRAIDGLIDTTRARLSAYATHRALAGPDYQLALRRRRLDELTLDLGAAILGNVDRSRQRLKLLELHLKAANPIRRIDQLRSEIAARARALGRASRHVYDLGEGRLATLAGKLESLSPLGVIARGYSVVRDDKHRVVRRLDQAPEGALIEARLTDGWLRARVEGQKKQRLNEPETPYSV